MPQEWRIHDIPGTCSKADLAARLNALEAAGWPVSSFQINPFKDQWWIAVSREKAAGLGPASQPPL